MFELIIHVICLWLYTTALEIDPKCKVDCACCLDKACGPGKWFDNECLHGCIDGYFGARCYKKCTNSNCKKCNNIDPACTECNDGYYLGPGNDCTSKCLPNCKTCTSGRSCTSCKEEYYNDKNSNDCRFRKCPENCMCQHDQCVSCKNGFYNTSNSCNSLCPGNCVTCSSSTHCDSCINGHYNGYQYDNKSLPLLNDCTHECLRSCLNCLSFDSCSVCKTGLYGSICEKVCSAGCVTGFCDIKTGNCNCSPNFVGDKCDRCNDGKYGDMCDEQCSRGCKGNVCEKKLGGCINGCIVDTIVGNKCDMCASSGFYGHNCNLTCSVGCKNYNCKKTDGECSFGCSNNYEGQQCDQCINGKYGDLCSNNCNYNCVNRACLKESGNCIRCVENFSGEKCDSCVNGLYGSTCSEQCPSMCLNRTCVRVSGKCSHGCVDNHSGDRCCVNNSNCIICSSDTNCKLCKSGYFKEQCDKRCHQNCIDSCKIETGTCDNCKSNTFGEHCQFTCASTCRNQENASENVCHRTNGTCRHGCVDGFYGVWCSKNCSSYCIDTICNQDDGKCIKGSQPNVSNNSLCPLFSVPLPEQSQNTVAILLGIILAVSVVGNIIFVTILIFRNYLHRKSKGGPVYENTDFELKCETVTNVKDSPKATQASNNINMAYSRDYEDLGSIQGIYIDDKSFVIRQDSVEENKDNLRLNHHYIFHLLDI